MESYPRAGTSPSQFARPAFVALALGVGLVVASRLVADHEDDAKTSPGDKPIPRVLHIGDSHTAGIYGAELHRLLTEAGVTVDTQASAGSSPSWWLNRTVTRYGFAALHADGTSERVAYQTPYPTPLLSDLLDAIHPDVVVVSLGANLRGSGAAAVRSQVEKLASVVRDAEAGTGRGARWIWVGPPNTRETAASPESDAAFYEALRAAAVDFGATFIDSRPLTPTYAGPDGLHFGGEQGTELAKRWAAGVFQQLKGLGIGG